MREGELAEVPQPHGSVRRATGGLVAVLREGQARHRSSVSGQRVRVLQSAHVPDAQGAGGRTGAEDQAVGVEGPAGVLGQASGGRVGGALEESTAVADIQKVPALRGDRYQVVARGLHAQAVDLLVVSLVGPRLTVLALSGTPHLTKTIRNNMNSGINDFMSDEHRP